jgi:hypothetical protein
VLLAYSKMWLSDEIVASELPEDPWIGSALERYFPSTLRERLAAYIPRHPLKREIVATYVLNSMVNRVGATFVHRMVELSNARPTQVVRAYLLAREVFGDVALWQQVEALDNVVADAVQAELLIAEGRLTARATTWFLRSRRLAEPMAATIERFQAAVAALATRLAPQAAASPRAQGWLAVGVPAALATRVAAADGLLDALDIAEVAEGTQRGFDEVCEVHVGVGERLGLARLRAQIDALPARTNTGTSVPSRPWARTWPTCTACWRSRCWRRRARPACRRWCSGRPTMPPRWSVRSGCWPTWRRSSRPTWRCSRWRCASCATWRDAGRVAADSMNPRNQGASRHDHLRPAPGAQRRELRHQLRGAVPVSFVERSAEVFGDLPAVVHGARRYTWAQTRERSARLAAALRRFGIGRGTR